MISPDRDALERAFDRIAAFPDFQPVNRAWWLNLREAVQHWLERNEDAGIRAAHDGVKAFPEYLPDERARWLALRAAVKAILDRES